MFDMTQAGQGGERTNHQGESTEVEEGAEQEGVPRPRYVNKELEGPEERSGATHSSERRRETDDPPPDPCNDDFQKGHERATVLAREGQLCKACSALLGEPRASYSESVAGEMCDRHPASQAEDPSSRFLRSPRSAAGPSGLRRQHIKTSREAYRDDVVRALHSVVMQEVALRR